MVSQREMIEGYNRFWGSLSDDSDIWDKDLRSLRVKAIMMISTNDSPVLDIGCGNGIAMKRLRNNGINVIGIDISRRALADAQSYGEVLIGDSTKLPFMDSSFRSITMLDVLEHIIDKKSAITEVHRILEKGGKLYLTIPFPKATAGEGDGRQPYDCPVTFSELMRLCSDNFELQFAYAIGWMPDGLHRLERMFPAKMHSLFPPIIRRADQAMMMFSKID